MGNPKSQRKKVLVDASGTVNASILAVSTFNPSGCVTEAKKDGINALVRQEGCDVLGVTETMFPEGGEPSTLVEGFRTFYNSVSRLNKKRYRSDETVTHKWGVAIVLKDNIRVGDVVRPKGVLEGRAIFVSTFYESCDKPKPVWIVCVYAPVRTEEHEVFYRVLEKTWRKVVRIKPEDVVISVGDLNGHILGPAVERTNYNPSYNKNPEALRNFLSKVGLQDARDVNGVFNIYNKYTYSHHDGTRTKLDYVLSSRPNAVINHQVVDFLRVNTKHRVISTHHNLFELVFGWKSPLIPYDYPKPFRVSKLDREGDQAFAEAEDKWFEALDAKLYQKVCDAHTGLDGLTEDDQETFLEELNKLCVDEAGKIWIHPSFHKSHKRSKEEGILVGKLAWIRRALDGALVLEEANNGSGYSKEKIQAALVKVSRSLLLPDLVLKDWSASTPDQISQWRSKLTSSRLNLRISLHEIEQKHRDERTARAESFQIREGSINSSAFRRWRLQVAADPDGEAILSKEGEILVVAQAVIRRFEEYYSELLSGEEGRTSPPDQNKRKIWMNPDIMAANKRKLQEALNGKSIAESPPTFREYLDVIDGSDPTSSGGNDRIQYGILQKLSIGTHQAIFGMVAWWWKQRTIPSSLKLVEICSLHKKGDRLDLFNKRGIGLISKLVLIFETILCRCMVDALRKAGTRSKAQGGAVKGVHTLDIITTLINVIAHAKRNNKSLHVVEFDLYKFFDKIPHRAFVDAHRYFGFDDDTIELASLFWTGFSTMARTRFGYTSTFPVEIGNIQGLVGSPFRSCLVLDMFLKVLEGRGDGYKFKSRNHDTVQEHELDDIIPVIYALGWVDDLWIIDEDYTSAVAASLLYNDFANYYSMRFVFDKCHHYVLNDTVLDSEKIVLTDYKGNSGVMPVVPAEKAFRCLGVFLSLELNWDEHVNHLVVKLRNVADKLSKRWSPPTITARIVNSNAVPAISYGLPVVDLTDTEISLLQGLLVNPVAKDGNHNHFVPRKAYCMAIKKGGYNLTNVEAMYKSSKVAYFTKVINGVFHLASITTRMTLLDLQRWEEDTNFPWNGNFSKWSAVNKGLFPKYIKTVALVLKEVKAAILPNVMWDLTRITVDTFAKCVAGWASKSTLITQLAEIGYIRMADVSHWFAASHNVEGVLVCPLTKAILLNEWLSDAIIAENPIKGAISEVDGVGPVRLMALSKVVVDGFRHIMDGDNKWRWTPIEVRRTLNWQRHKFRALPKDDTLGIWFTDGSKMTDGLPRASWAVVNDKGKPVSASIIEGRVTSQRGECFGLLAGRAMGPCKLLVADPLPVINTIVKANAGSIPDYQWPKVNNRSLIRNISFLSSRAAAEYKWVKSHQEGFLDTEALGNFAADLNAKKAANEGILPIIPESWEFTDDYAFVWKGKLYEGSIRNKVLNAVVKINVRQMCNEKGKARYKHESWWMELPDKAAQYKFGHLRFKLFTRSLPTYHRLAKRFQHLFEDRLCPSCGLAKETDSHIFVECTAYAKHKQDAWDEVAAILADAMESDDDIQNLVKNWICIPFNSNEASGWWFLGGVPDEVKVWLSSKYKGRDRLDIWNNIHNVVMKAVKSIWKDRCELNRNKKGLLKDLLEDEMINKAEEEFMERWNEADFDLEAAFLDYAPIPDTSLEAL